MSETIADADRLAKLKELAAAGLTGGEASYFNKLIDTYARTQSLTDPERKRIDQFLASHHG
jgi:hypothetical protein